MSDYLGDLLATDAALDALGARTVTAYDDDDVLSGLAFLALAVDECPLPASVTLPARQPQQARKCGWALSVTVALTLASGGVAAAVADDPLAPFQYVKDRLLWSPSEAPSGWDFIGAPPASSVPVRVGSMSQLPDGTAGLAVTHIRTTLPDEMGGAGSGGSRSSGTGGQEQPPAGHGPPSDPSSPPPHKPPPSEVGSGTGHHGGDSGPSDPTSPTLPDMSHRSPANGSPAPPSDGAPKMRLISGKKPPKRGIQPQQPAPPSGVVSGGGLVVPGAPDPSPPAPSLTGAPTAATAGIAASTAGASTP